MKSIEDMQMQLKKGIQEALVKAPTSKIERRLLKKLANIQEFGTDKNKSMTI